MGQELQKNDLPAGKRDQALRCVETLGRLAALFEERRRQLAESVGLSVAQWRVLEVIQTEHFMPSLFAQEQERSPAAISKLLRQLTDKGLIVARVSDLDGRHREYAVTQSGRDALHALRQERERAIEKVWLELTSQELVEFEILGSKLATRIAQVASEKKESK